MICAHLLRSVIDYDPQTGLFEWKVRSTDFFEDGSKSKQHQANAWNGRFAGKPALTAKTNGYFAGRIFHKHIYAHRAAIAFMTGEWPKMGDHISGDITDNRWINLRSCTPTENCHNARASGGTSKYKGVSQDPRSGSWVANIRAHGTKKYLGAFPSEAMAARAYDDAAVRLHGSFARPNFPIEQRIIT